MGFCLRIGRLAKENQESHREVWKNHFLAGVKTISFGAYLSEMKDDFAKDMRQKWQEEFSLKISSIHYFDGTYSADLKKESNEKVCENFRKYAAAYGKSGAEVIVLHAGTTVNSGLLVEDWRLYREGCEKFGEMRVLEVMAKNLQSFSDTAEEYNMRIAIENIGGMLPAGDIKTMKILEEFVARENFGFCIDTGHAFYGKEEITDYLEFAGKKLFATHIHDNHGTKDEHLFPGEGDINWLPVIRKLKALGYSREWMFECGGLPDPDPVNGLIRARERWQELCEKA